MDYQETYSKYKSKLSNNSRFYFFSVSKKIVRSTLRRSEFLNSKIRWSDYIPDAAAGFLTSLSQNEDNPRNLFLSKQFQFLILYFKENVLDTLPTELTQKFPTSTLEQLDFIKRIFEQKEVLPSVAQIQIDKTKRALANIEMMKHEYAAGLIKTCRFSFSD